METKKTKLTISGKPRKNLYDNRGLTNDRKKKAVTEKKFSKPFSKYNPGSSKFPKKSFSGKPSFPHKTAKTSFPSKISDYERRKLAEQRATKKINNDTKDKDNKNKFSTKKRELKLTVSRALSEDIEFRSRSLASIKRAREKELRENKNLNNDENSKNVKREVSIPELITIRDLANRMAEQSSSIIKHLMGMGVTVTINHTIDSDTAEYLVKEFGHIPLMEKKAEEIVSKIKQTKSENLQNRPPIITVMGHVDHGKTSVLDVLRKTNVVSGEHGGITQHVGAYQIIHNNEKITFIDTPGHAAFTEMRARGSKLTDIVVLVVAANDGVKPQTIESIKHAKAAKVPIVVAINKCDLPDADPKKVKNQLLEYELISEDLSGDTLMVEISAKTKKNIDKLLETITLQAELLDLKTDYDNKATGIVLESKIDIGRGPIANIIVTSGKLKKGDHFVCGPQWGKVRAIIDDNGKSVDEALPSTPVEILGISGASKSGDDFLVLDTDKEAKVLSEARINEAQSKKGQVSLITQDSAFKDQTSEELNIIIKSDVHGSSEAIKNAVNLIKHDEVKPKIILSDVGMVTETDVNLAKASNAVLIAFNVKPSKEAKKIAEQSAVKISSFNIIYELIDFVKIKMSGLLSPDVEESITGSAEILEIFKVSKVGKVAGSKVTMGEISQDSLARVIRDGTVVFTGKIGSIFREKNQTKQVTEGLECGITLKNFNDFQKRDIIEAYNSKTTERSV
ncbi:translation initiation factor IF-2 [Candidatus Pelagibacter communis]|uniref:translation initiation factor IF-2 n=1 Tax=Pelagibacter ubique TaxID=198252 RepID=UPI00094D1D5E|nr:translation initiation factor IF-2 [Candidatus Pelagibacter ubique]